MGFVNKIKVVYSNRSMYWIVKLVVDFVQK